MAGRDRSVIYDDRETVYTTGSGIPPTRRVRPSDLETYERYEEDRPTYRRTSEVRTRSRSRDRSEAGSRLPTFMRDDRRPDGGTMVLRQVETVSRPRGRSPSPAVRFVEERVVRRARSESPPLATPLPPPPVKDRVEVRERYVERRGPPPRGRSGSPHPNAERIRTRFVSRERSVSRERGRSPSPGARRESETIRVVERERQRVVPPKPAPEPPTVIRGPTIEREVITHYKDIDHGIVAAPRPRPAPRIYEESETEIDITRSRDRTEVDVRRRRSRSRERRMSGALVVARPPSPKREVVYYDDVVEDRHRLRVDIEDRHRSTSVSAEHVHGGPSGPRPRARSAAPPYADEAAEITGRIDARGRMGEARGGVTRDWTIVDVPPGTERIRMDGAGGAGVDVDYSRYSGVRRSKFVPDRDAGALVMASAASSTTSTSASEHVIDVRTRGRSRSRERRVVEMRARSRSRDRLNVQVMDKCQTDIEIEKTSRSKPRRPTDDMWTEITKDLVVREAIEEFGYEYEETEWFFYIMQYLSYEDVLELTEYSDDIRRHRKKHARQVEWERQSRRHRARYDDDIYIDHQLVVEQRPPVRGYLR